jgi:hypothetical protein
MTGTATDPRPLPWYRHPWPWFIVALLASTVAAGITTAVIAFENADDLVRDDYYRDGIEINRSLASDALSRRLGLHGSARLEDGHMVVVLDGASAIPDTELVLELSHATLAARDRRVALTRAGEGRFEGPLSGARPGRYYATLRPGPGAEAAWRLVGTVELPSASAFALEPTP